jgi:uncharacterized protein YdcH (DUF465 family)
MALINIRRQQMNQDFNGLDDNSSEIEKLQNFLDEQEIQELKQLAIKCGVKY